MTIPKLDCRCIDAESLSDLRLSLLTSRDTYDDLASRLIGMEIYKKSTEIDNILLKELEKIPPC